MMDGGVPIKAPVAGIALSRMNPRRSGMTRQYRESGKTESRRKRKAGRPRRLPSNGFRLSCKPQTVRKNSQHF
jgi:hypothetical protein